MGYCQPIPRHTPELGVGLVVLGLAGPAVNTALAAPSALSPALPLSYALLAPTPASPPQPSDLSALRPSQQEVGACRGGAGMGQRCSFFPTVWVTP